MIPRTIFSSEHEQFRDSVRKFLEQEAVPFHHQWEKDGHIDRALWNKAGEAGMLCSHIPEEYGGMAADFLYSTVVIEEVGRLGLTGIGFSLHSDIVAPYILHYGTEAQKQHYLPKLVSGEMVTAIAMTEPGAGSDLQGVKTTAVLDGDEYVINGSKTFITNGFLADLVIVVAKTDPKAGAKGTSLFLVEANTPGFSKGKRLEKVGMKAQDTSELFFQDVRVPRENLLGQAGMGFAYLMQELPQERLTVGLLAISSAAIAFISGSASISRKSASSVRIAATSASVLPVDPFASFLTAVAVSPLRKHSSWVSTPAVASMLLPSRASPTETFAPRVWCLASTVVFVLLASEHRCARSTHLA